MLAIVVYMWSWSRLVVHMESISCFPSCNYPYSRVNQMLCVLSYGMLLLLWDW